MKQVAHADVVIDYESEMRLFVRASSQGDSRPPVRLSELDETIVGLHTGTNSAVVVMGPPMRMLPDREFEAKTVEIEVLLRRLGPKQAHLDLAVVHLEVFLDFCSQNLVAHNQYLLDSS